MWMAFCEKVIVQPDWLERPDYRTQALRVKNVDALERDIESVTTQQTTAHWVALLDAVGIPGGPVFGYEQTLKDPHVLARKMVHDIDHPIIGPMKTLGLPIKSSGALGSIRMPAPWLGQHSASVLAQLGYSAQDTEALFQQGAVFDQYRDKARPNA
jgi:crotonobetainyl-CoA:carnitine CoA-transferase CaiB-like acyl-CoA transferase